MRADRHRRPRGPATGPPRARRRVRRLLAGVALCVLALPATGALAQDATDRPVVTPSQQVTDNVSPTRAHNQPQLLVHPDDDDTLVIVESEFLSSTCHVHVSRDRGRTWAQASGTPVPEQYNACSRPTFGPYLAAAFGPDGTLYMAGAGSDTGSNRGPTDAYLARSDDLGETWDFTIIAEAEERELTTADGESVTDFDRWGYTRMAVHPTDPDRVYVGYRWQAAETPFAQVPVRTYVAVSTDGGQTFNEPVDIHEGALDVYGADVPAMAIAEDGTIYAFTKERPPPAPPPPPAPEEEEEEGEEAPEEEAEDPEPPEPEAEPAPTPPAGMCTPSAALEPDPEEEEAEEEIEEDETEEPAPPGPGEPGAGARLLMSRSTDDGATWEAAAIDDSGVVCIPCLTTPEAAIDHRTGTLYVVFEQSDSPPPNARDDRDIWMMTSTDGGDTWSDRVQLNDDDDPNRDPDYDQMFPGISIAPNGRVDVAWHDFRTDAIYNPAGTGKTDRSEQTCWDVFYTYSTDGGQTWAPNERISDRTMHQAEGYALHLSYDLRGPIGVASTDDVAHIAWHDSRDGSLDLPTEDVYVASVLHEGERRATQASTASLLFLGGAGGLLLAGLLAAGAALVLRARGS